jgi:hypothetical protein
VPELLDRPAGQPGSWLFLDTETSGLSGGTGTWAFLCGLLRVEQAELVLHQYLLARLDAEPAYLQAIGAELDAASLLVTYNGRSFDGPLLRTRFRLTGSRTTLGSAQHLDLLHLVRRAFARRWPDCRLTSAEERLLGYARRGDLPGSEAPAAWLAWLRRGETAPLLGVLDHNGQDLLSLPALASALAAVLRDPAAAGADVGAVARSWLSRGDEDMGFSVLSQRREGLDEAALMELARLHRRRGEWKEACLIWRRLASRGCSSAVEALVKYLEHRERDYGQALEWTDRLPSGLEKERRNQRLERKLRSGSPSLSLDG